MKKIQLMILTVVMAGVLCGCTNYAKEYDKNTLIIKGNESLVEVAVEDFKETSIKAEDLESYIEEQVTAYNDENGKKIKKKSINTEDMSKVKLVLTYKDIESFNGFNLLECSLDSFSNIKEAELAGTYTSADGESVKYAKLDGVDKAMVLITTEATDIVVKGDILYYNDEVKVKDGVATTTGEDKAIIIYK